MLGRLTSWVWKGHSTSTETGPEREVAFLAKVRSWLRAGPLTELEAPSSESSATLPLSSPSGPCSVPASSLPQSHPWSFQDTGQTALSQPGPLGPLHSSPAFASVLLYLPGKVPAFGAWVCLGSEPVPVSHVLYWDGAELDTEHDQLRMAHRLLGETLPSRFSLWPWSLGSRGLACTPGDEEQCLRTGWHACLYAHCLCCGIRVPNGAAPSIV